MSERSPPVLAIAGASGFIGQAISAELSRDFRLVALSRGGTAPNDHFSEARQVDLFSLRDAERGLEGVHTAVYLVHSMSPSARLVQAEFDVLDLLCADNFARAATASGVRHIVYLGGLHAPDQRLSSHLSSRAEVAQVLASTGIPVTTLQAGLILGQAGSSMQMLRKLVERLPVMLCPSWTQTRMQPVGVDDVVAAICHFCLHPPGQSVVRDLGAPEVLTYRELLLRTAAALHLKRRCVPVPFLSPKLSRLWVSLTTGAPRALTAPLVESLTHEMVAAPERLWQPPQPTGVDQALREALKSRLSERPLAFRRRAQRRATVRSVQRMRLPPGTDAAWALERYTRWLPRGLRGLVSVDKQESDLIRFRLFGKGPVLLELQPRPHRSEPSRQVLRVTGGILARETARGRLEFRQVLEPSTLIAGVHDFEPTLPWWLYRISQAQFHRWVMQRFSHHLMDPRHGTATSEQDIT